MGHIIWHIFYKKTNPFIISYILTFTVYFNKPGDIFVAKFNDFESTRLHIYYYFDYNFDYSDYSDYKSTVALISIIIDLDEPPS